jgi:F0F1-type ATP synthase delta subunit
MSSKEPAAILREIIDFEESIVVKLNSLLIELVAASELSDKEKNSCVSVLSKLRNDSLRHKETIEALLEEAPEDTT